MSFSPSNQPFKDEIELKTDLRSDTLDTRQEYDLKVSLKTNTSYTNIVWLKGKKLTDQWERLECQELVEHINYKQTISGLFQTQSKMIAERGFVLIIAQRRTMWPWLQLNNVCAPCPNNNLIKLIGVFEILIHLQRTNSLVLCIHVPTYLYTGC